MKNSHRILLVEDEVMLLENIGINLEQEGYEVRKVDNGHDAIEMLKSEKFSAVVLDIMLPRVSGLAVCEYARLNNNKTPILLLSAKSSVSDRIAGLKTGADDYLTKPFDLEELILRVERLVEKSAVKDLAPAVAAGEEEYVFGGHRFNIKSGIAYLADGSQKHLTKKERQIMKILIDHPNKLITREHILHSVWGYNIFPSTRTIDNFMMQLRKTFEPDASRPIFIHARRGEGYEFTPQGQED